MTERIYGGLIKGDIIHIDPRYLPELRIISAAEAQAIVDASPKREFIVSWGKPLTSYEP